MFKEPAPLVRHRAVLFTVSHVEADQFRVNVIPKKTTDGENDALTTPVSVTGTVEDLDKELPETLLHFVSSHLELKNFARTSESRDGGSFQGCEGRSEKEIRKRDHEERSRWEFQQASRCTGSDSCGEGRTSQSGQPVRPRAGACCSL
jgi:PRTRC genetic system protein E